MVKLTRGERFKDARIVHNQHGKQTMDEVAAATGLQKSLIQALEDDSANRSVGYDKVAKLAAHYHVSADYLLGLSDVVSPNTEIRAMCDSLGLSEKTVKTFELANRTFHEVTTLKSYDDMHAMREFAEAANMRVHAESAACTANGLLRFADDMVTMVLSNPSIGSDFFMLTCPADPPNEHTAADYLVALSAAYQINHATISDNDMKRFQIYEIATAVSNYLKLKYAKGRDDRGLD